MGPPFRFSAKYGLFTYAQCSDLDPFDVVNHFASLRAECIIGREEHADGGVHLHAFCMWQRRFETTSPRKFDVEDRHPNIVAGYGTPEKGYDYATKDGDVVGGGLERPCGDSMDKSGSKWSEITAAKSADEFWDLVGQMDPRALCCNFTSLQKFVEWKYRTDPAEYASPAGIQFDLAGSPRLSEWCGANIDVPVAGKLITWCPPGGRVGPLGPGASSLGLSPSPAGPFDKEMLILAGRRRSLCLYGDTRLGKTLWARSLGKHAYYGGLFSLDESIIDVKYAVFDDINGGLKFFPNYKSWLGCQEQFYCTDKYKGKKLVHWGRPCIWLSNEDPRTNEGVDIDWLEGNCDFVHVRFPIFRANTPSPDQI